MRLVELHLIENFESSGVSACGIAGGTTGGVLGL